MAKVPLEELIEIAESSKQDGFEQNYIDAARAELERRDVDAVLLEEARNDREILLENEAGKHLASLSNTHRLALALIGPILILSISAIIILRSRGYTQKSEEALLAVLAGILFWGVVPLAALFTLGWLGVL